MAAFPAIQVCPTMKMPSVLVALLAASAVCAVQAAQPTPAAGTPKLAYGQMMKHGDKVIFSPCRDPSYAMFEDVSANGALTQALAGVGLNAGKKVYAELLGVLDNNVLKASELNFAHTDGRCQLPGGEDESWRAAGHEPGWVLAVGKEVVVLKRQGQPDIRVPTVAFKSEGKQHRLESAEGGNTLQLNFERGLCRDIKADSAFGWNATVSINGQLLKGCAWQR